jgi:hypothetical protein
MRNVQTLDFVLDETDTSNVPKYYVRLRDGLLVSPTDGDDNVVPHVQEDITTLEDSDFMSLSGGGEDGEEVIHHQKPRLPPTNGGHLKIWSQYSYQQQAVENSGRNLRGRSSSSDDYPDDSQPNSPTTEVEEIAFIYDEDDPEENDELEGYDIGTTQQQRELSLADAFVSQTKEEPKGKPQGKSSCLPSGKPLPENFLSVFPCTGSKIGNFQAFGARIATFAEVDNVYLQLKDCKRKRSSWKNMPASPQALDWHFKELAGFEKCDKWNYRLMTRDSSRKREMTEWMELVIDIERDTPNPTPLPTSNPIPPPSPEPTSPPSPLPTPGPTLPPSPKPTPWPTPPPSPQPTSHPIDSSGQWTENPTKPPTSKPPTNEPTPFPTNEPTPPPSNPPTPQPSSPPTPQPISPTPQPTTPPSPEQATLLQRYVRDDPWEYSGKIQYSSGRVLFFFDGNPYVCTGTVVDDGSHSDRTIVLTAGHCAFKYDSRGGRFADYAFFIPNQDETRGRGTDEDCSNDPLGCWTPLFALVDYEWTTKSFPLSVPWDYAFYVIPNTNEAHTPGFIYNTQPELSRILEDVVERFPIDFTYDQSTAPATMVHGLGYTFSKDPDFRYCAQALGTKYGISTYKNLWLSPCDMSGGSSGGPWMKDTMSDGTGTIISVNSWGYSSSTGMAGPNFYTEGGSKVECLFERAKSADFNEAKNGGIIVSDC